MAVLQTASFVVDSISEGCAAGSGSAKKETCYTSRSRNAVGLCSMHPVELHRNISSRLHWSINAHLCHTQHLSPHISPQPGSSGWTETGALVGGHLFCTAMVLLEVGICIDVHRTHCGFLSGCMWCPVQLYRPYLLRQIFGTVLTLRVTEGFTVGSGRAVEDILYTPLNGETPVRDRPRRSLRSFLVLSERGGCFKAGVASRSLRWSVGSGSPPQ